MSGFPKEVVLLTVRELRKQCSRRLSRKVKPTRNSAPVPANVMTAEEVPNKQVLAFLGPEGTYTHQVSFLIFFFRFAFDESCSPPPPTMQAANDYFGESVSYIPCHTIACKE